MFKVIICGSRNFNSLPYLTEKCDYLLSRESDIEIVSGMARGADYLGSVYGNNHDYKLSGFEAEWDKYGKSAGSKEIESWATMQTLVSHSGIVHRLERNT